MIRSWFYVSILALSLLSLDTQAQEGGGGNGQYFLNSSLYYGSKLQQRNSKTDQQLLLLDFKLGYNVADGFYIGPAFGLHNETVKTSGYSTASNNYTSEYKRQSYGLFGAYLYDMYYAMLTYHLSSKMTEKENNSSGNTTSEYSGSAIILDFGLKISLGSFSIGPNLSYRMYTYSKVKTGGATQSLNPTLKFTEMQPTICLWVML